MEKLISENEIENEILLLSKSEIFFENSLLKNPRMKIIINDGKRKNIKSLEVKSGFHLEKYVKSLYPQEKIITKILAIFQKDFCMMVVLNYYDEKEDTVDNPLYYSKKEKEDDIYKYIKIDHIERFISDIPFKTPPMIMCIKDNKGKIINNFKIPSGFLLENYVKSLYPNEIIKSRIKTIYNYQEVLIIDVIKNNEIIESYWGHYFYIWIDIKKKLNNELIKSYTGYYLIDN